YAAALEFMHNATLLHDDVVDESEMRRGKPAARKIWGNQASVLVGDFLLGQAFMMMVDAGSLPALKVLSSAAAVIAEGEVLQLSVATNLDTSEEEYFEVIGAKTAALFEAATEVGAMADDPSNIDRPALARYGRELGVAFQLTDDVLDYGGAGGVLGKNTGDDLREGKMTLPIIVALRSATGSEREQIGTALGDGTVDAQRFSSILDIVKRYGGLDYTLERAHRHAEAARAALEPLPASQLKDILADMGDYCVGRAY
ncbi:MAG TPA: polyprenyl synthetase family protein, partial [Devosia sp.]|nr:polyprenyl synthetase family protein [Devosia sp.]